jgi:putative ABC transport system ATP-binding protein
MTRAGSAPLVVVDGVTKTYRAGAPDEVRAVRGVSLTVDRGEVVALEGPSGSGKTSLLSLIGCMSRPTSGQVMVDGRAVSRLSEIALTAVRRSTFGFIFQHLYLIPDLSVEDNVGLPLVPTGIRSAEIEIRVGRALDMVAVSHRRRAPVGRISGGEQQRTAIARALINEPAILVADEPTAHLDSALSSELLDILVDLNGRGMTVIIATHDPRVIDHPIVGRRMMIMDGELIEGNGR